MPLYLIALISQCNFCDNRKIARYSPSEAAKIYEKAMQRHAVAQFNPKATIEIIDEEHTDTTELSDKEKRCLVERYRDVCIN